MKPCSRCGKDTSYWQRSSGDLCQECAEAAASDAELKRRVAELAAAESRERRSAYRSKCVACGGTNLQDGYIPDSGGTMWTGGDRLRFKTDIFDAKQLRALACLTCGHVSLWIALDELHQ